MTEKEKGFILAAVRGKERRIRLQANGGERHIRNADGHPLYVWAEPSIFGLTAKKFECWDLLWCGTFKKLWHLVYYYGTSDNPWPPGKTVVDASPPGKTTRDAGRGLGSWHFGSRYNPRDVSNSWSPGPARLDGRPARSRLSDTRCGSRSMAITSCAAHLRSSWILAVAGGSVRRVSDEWSLTGGAPVPGPSAAWKGSGTAANIAAGWSGHRTSSHSQQQGFSRAWQAMAFILGPCLHAKYFAKCE